MRVLALGGAGAVCRHAVMDLAQSKVFDEIVIGESNLPAAEKLAEEIGDAGIRITRINAESEPELIEACGDSDVVMNGLPFKYDLPVTKACIEAGVDGLDVSTVEKQWDYDQAARERGVVFVPGVGATPGITNMMAKRGADYLDELDEVRIHFAAFRCIAPAPGLLTTFLWEFHPGTQERVYYADGEFHPVGPFEGLKTITFPGPIGAQEVCYIPHPETHTIPKSLGAKAVSVHGCFPPQAMQLGRVLFSYGFLTDEALELFGRPASPFETIHTVLMQLPAAKQTHLWAYGLVVEVLGRKEERQAKLTFWNRHPSMDVWGGQAAYYKNIALPLSIGAQMIGRGEVKGPGVLPPETALDPGIFFRELADRDIDIHESIELYMKIV